MNRLRVFSLLWLIACPIFVGCNQDGSSDRPVIGVSFETLQTEFWVAGFDAIRSECEEKGYQVVESVADGDANRQLQQVNNMITRGVDGIILVPKDRDTCGPMIRAANKAGIPIVLFNRPAPESDETTVAVVADNLKLAEQTTEFLIQQAKTYHSKIEAMILVGDLGDSNAIARRDGFDNAVKRANESGFQVEVVARVPTEWNQEKAQAGVVNAIQANPDIGLIFTSSDFLFPSIVSALQSAGKYHKYSEKQHVLLGGFDGDAMAYRLLQQGYLDATGVQNVYFEAEQCVSAIDRLRNGEKLAGEILDSGFVIHRDNMDEVSAQMWGAQVGK